jgi:eukaryotic-like serine/threonine-protein kinase
MSHPATNLFFDGIQSSRLLDDTHVNELKARPEAAWGDVVSLSNYAQDRGWLTPYQTLELREGRGSKLTIGGYQIFDKIADGPSGVTYKALHPALQQPVSLRLLKADWLRPVDSPGEFIARAQAASLAQSPYLAIILDAGSLDEGPFVVMEYVEGCDLFRLVNELGALPIGLACEYVRQAALALKAAHEKDVVHGDVSPHTLLLSPVKRTTGSNGEESVRPRPGASVKLAELALTPRRPPIGELTYGESDRLGPVAFLPPERLTSSDRTAAGDCYGLGATLYFLLTTRPPHGGESPLATLLSLQHEEPASIESLKSDVPPPVADLIRRLLDRNLYSRPSVSDVVETLFPYCEPSAMSEPAPLPAGVLVAHETSTQPTIPTAVPVARNLDLPDSVQTTEPFANVIDEPLAEEIPPSSDQPLVEPLPEVHPLDAQYNSQTLVPDFQPLDEHHDQFDHTAMGADKPRAPRPRAKASSKQKTLIIVGLILHLTATTMCLSWMGILPNPFAKSNPDSSQVEEKKETPKTKKKRNY